MKTTLQLAAPLLALCMGIFSCTKTDTVPAPPEAANRILEFRIVNVTGDPIYGAVNDEDSSIQVYLPYDKQLVIIEPEITVSEGATVTPESGTMVEDLLDYFWKGRDLRYVVKSKDGATRTYTLHISVQQPDLYMEELSPDAENITGYELDLSQIYTNIFLVARGSGFSENHELVRMVLVKDDGTELPPLPMSVTNTNNISELTAVISAYPGSMDETIAALKTGGLYRLRIYSYSKVSTMHHPIRITVKN
ncbi:hypothetical protein [Chitinophaga cymbidii]|uniref:DUF5018 domain-containing protein n=1 Tax=Chitinophaga cymbidii TaxID=1096750 RepID=A0A512RDM5_9BACT|nr:hypothetical protein [Chitinophaga cymbidii]GEP93802.1 hypothetical protein CCY01nite_00620 [Chitinophaga cymbidii]